MFVIHLIYLLASLIPVSNRHVQVEDNNIIHFKAAVLPLINYMFDMLFLVLHRLSCQLECLKAVLGLNHLEVHELQYDVHHKQLTAVIIGDQAAELAVSFDFKLLAALAVVLLLWLLNDGVTKASKQSLLRISTTVSCSKIHRGKG